tara:strand:- start:3388 stop:4404 length:1017 start_codon:yes stop_codon:yes gene_type:complete
LKITSNPKDINKESWSDFVLKHPDGNIFQTPEFFSVYKDSKNHEPIFICAYQNDKIIGILVSFIQSEFGGPFRILSSRALVLGGPLIIHKYYQQILPHMLSRLNDCVKSKSLFTEIRNFFNTERSVEIFEQCGYNYSPHLNFIINLKEGREKAWENLSQSKRRSIRKGIHNGSIVEESSKKSVLKEYYRGLNFFYKNTVRKPLPQYSYFEQIFDKLLPKEMAKLFIVRNKESKIIGGILCAIYQRKIYELFIFSERNLQNKNLFASEIATWEPINWGSKEGMGFFDLMGAGKPEEEYGVRKFKRGFGGNLVSYGRYKSIHYPILHNFVMKISELIKNG